MRLSDIFKQHKIASGETAIPEQFSYVWPDGKSPAFDKDACGCDMSPEQVNKLSELSGRLSAGTGSTSGACIECKHPAYLHQQSGCSHGSKILEPTRYTLETTYLPHDGEMKSSHILAQALIDSGLADENEDHRTILNSLGNLESTHHTSEARRVFHKAIFDTIHKLVIGGRLPTDDVPPGAPRGIFHDASHNVELLQKMAEHHGGSIEGMYDAYRKYSGTPVEALGLGLTSNNLGENYKRSQLSANDSARTIKQDATTETVTSTDIPDNCQLVCVPAAKEMKRFWDSYLASQEVKFSNGGVDIPDGRGGTRPSTSIDGAAYATDQWSKLESGHVRGERLSEDSHAWLIAAQDVLDRWRGSGHLYGDAHEKPGTSSLASTPIKLAQSDIGTGERHPSWLHNIFRTVVDGARSTAATTKRQNDKTLQNLWQYASNESGVSPSSDRLGADDIFALQKHINKLENHLRSNGAAHIADRFIKREPVLEQSDQCTPWCKACTIENKNKALIEEKKEKGLPYRSDWRSTIPHEKMMRDGGRQRVTIDTGRQIIKFITGKTLPEDEEFAIPGMEEDDPEWTPTNVVRYRPTVTARLGTYGEGKPHYTDLDKYILKRGAGIDLDETISTSVSDPTRLSCRGKREQVGTSEDGTPLYANRAVRPSLIPDDVSTSRRYPVLEEHDCTEHDGHDFDSDGNIIGVRTARHRLIKPEEKGYWKDEIEDALSAIDPFAYDDNRENLILNLGAQMDRYHRGETDINNRYIGGGSRDTERPRFSPGGERDLLGDTEQQIRNVTPTESQIEGKPPKKRTRKK